jgi:hypothetical protein
MCFGTFHMHRAKQVKRMDKKRLTRSALSRQLMVQCSRTFLGFIVRRIQQYHKHMCYNSYGHSQEATVVFIHLIGPEAFIPSTYCCKKKQLLLPITLSNKKRGYLILLRQPLLLIYPDLIFRSCQNSPVIFSTSYCTI